MLSFFPCVCSDPFVICVACPLCCWQVTKVTPAITTFPATLTVSFDASSVLNPVLLGSVLQAQFTNPYGAALPESFAVVKRKTQVWLVCLYSFFCSACLVDFLSLGRCLIFCALLAGRCRFSYPRIFVSYVFFFFRRFFCRFVFLVCFPLVAAASIGPNGDILCPLLLLHQIYISDRGGTRSFDQPLW